MFVHDSPVAVGQWSPILGFIVVMMFTFSVHSYDRQVKIASGGGCSSRHRFIGLGSRFPTEGPRLALPVVFLFV